MGQAFAKEIPHQINMAEAANGDYNKEDKVHKAVHDCPPNEVVKPKPAGRAPPLGCGDSLVNRELTLDGLLSMTPVVHGVDIVRQASRDLFLSCIKSQRNVHNVFFPQHSPHALEKKVDPHWFEFDIYACLYVCKAICNLEQTYGIKDMIKEERVNRRLEEIYSEPLWKKIGFSLYTMFFPDLVRDPHSGVGFRSYIQNGRYVWAAALSDKMKDTQWLHSVIRSKPHQVESQFNENINLLFIKLHLLDPTAVFPVYDHLRKDFSGLNLELVTTNYLGDALDWRLIRREVQEALQRITAPRNVNQWSIDTYEVYYGIQVAEFVFMDAKELGLWTGKYPDNKRYCSIRDRIPFEKCEIL